MQLKMYQDKLLKAMTGYILNKKDVPLHREMDISALKQLIKKATSVASLTIELEEYLDDMVTGFCLAGGNSDLKRSLLKVMEPVIRSLEIEKLQDENAELRKTVTVLQSQMKEMMQVQTKMIEAMNKFAESSKPVALNAKEVKEDHPNASSLITISYEEYHGMLRQNQKLSAELFHHVQSAKDKNAVGSLSPV